MRTIVAGSRSVTQYETVADILYDYCVEDPISVLISGGARGVDKLGELWAKANNIPVEIYPAEWDLYGKKAGYIRNKFMADKAEALVAIWDGESRGTEHMITIAKQKGLKVFVVDLSE